MLHIEMQKQDLQTAVNRVSGAATDRSLASIGLRTSNGSLELYANDRSIAIYCTCETTIHTEGLVFVPAKLFSDVVRELPQGKTLAKQEGAFLKIESLQDHNFEMKIPLVEGMHWHEAPEYKAEDFMSLNASQLAYMIDQVQFTISTDSPRNYGTVGYLHTPAPGTLRLVGTDGYRLSHCDVEMESIGSAVRDGICLSKRALQELIRMSQEGFEKLDLALDLESGSMLARLPGYKLFVRLSAVKFPNYQAVLPKAVKNSLSLERQKLQHVAKRVMLAADKSRAVRLKIEDNQLELSARTSGSSEGKEVLNLEGAALENPRSVTINGRFLTDVFQATQSQQIEMCFQEKSSDPIVLVPVEEPERCKSLHVLVPIRDTQQAVQ
jgi:DNA polymerase-3 subunit beta